MGAIIVRRERIAGLRGPGRAIYLMNPNVGDPPWPAPPATGPRPRRPPLRLVEPAGR